MLFVGVIFQYEFVCEVIDIWLVQKFKSVMIKSSWCKRGGGMGGDRIVYIFMLQNEEVRNIVEG